MLQIMLCLALCLCMQTAADLHFALFILQDMNKLVSLSQLGVKILSFIVWLSICAVYLYCFTDVVISITQCHVSQTISQVS